MFKSLLSLLLFMVVTINSSAQEEKENLFNPFGEGMAGVGSSESSSSEIVGFGIGSGVGDVYDRKVVREPEIENPTNEEGRVMLELIINREGKVISVKVKQSHPSNTTANPILFEAAEKTAWGIVYGADPEASEFEKVFKLIEFRLP